ncbi:hypothetical protein PybrP1_009754 [[Pythium] brassicae (nom. inval.)]|nr:hypothetical protein PybrP1_009754 [[Pythium] brassicae (nom. inval.)]
MRRMTVEALALSAAVLLALSYVVLIGFESSVLDFGGAVFDRREATSLSVSARSTPSTRGAVSTDSESFSDVGDGSPATAVVDEQAQHPATTPDATEAAQPMRKWSAGLWLDEILTPEMVKQIEARERKQDSASTNNHVDPLAPVQVHMVWIGQVSKAPTEHTRYRDLGYNLTVHSDPEEILNGFHPFVLKAYRLAVPSVVGYDFLKFALLYKHGGLAVDADTQPVVDASEVQREFPRNECDVVFGKEAAVKGWKKPVFRKTGGPKYGLIRPFQILNWAMAASKPRNGHIKWLMQTAMMHFFGMRDMEMSLVQDISGSGLMTDYVALLHEKHGRSYREVFEDHDTVVPVEGLCLTDGHFRGQWIDHSFANTWRQPGRLSDVSLLDA